MICSFLLCALCVREAKNTLSPSSFRSSQQLSACWSISHEESFEPCRHGKAVQGLIGGQKSRPRGGVHPGHELVQVAPNMGAGGSHHQSTPDQDWTQKLHEIRRMAEFLLHRKRKLDVNTDVAVKRFQKDNSQLHDEERETSLTEAFADKTKIAKLVVYKWFVDKATALARVRRVRPSSCQRCPRCRSPRDRH